MQNHESFATLDGSIKSNISAKETTKATLHKLPMGQY
jgi:hypothetical protein